MTCKKHAMCHLTACHTDYSPQTTSCLPGVTSDTLVTVWAIAGCMTVSGNLKEKNFSVSLRDVLGTRQVADAQAERPSKHRGGFPAWHGFVTLVVLTQSMARSM